MKTSDLFHETYSALIANKVRTGLTMLGIIIGIASVIAMVAIGSGAQSSIEDRIKSIGSNLVQVLPGAPRGVGTQVSTGRGSSHTLKLDDAKAISDNINGINAVAPEISGRYQVTSKGTNTNTSIVGTTASYPTVRNLQLQEGDFISDTEVKNLSKVAVIGPTVESDLFGSEVSALGNVIRINGMQFKVIGITASKGGSGASNQDDMIFIPISSAQQFLIGDDYVSAISVQVTDDKNMPEVQQAITDVLLDRHNISDSTLADFNVINQNDIVATASSVTSTFTILLAAVAGISLLVGGIGIMNMMLTTVTERTREIGLRKAIGAKAADINAQFLTEALTLTLFGGIIGVILGTAISFLVTHFGVIETKVSVTSILLAFGVSAFIGIIFGYYPARRASRLNPIEALRYE